MNFYKIKRKRCNLILGVINLEKNIKFAIITNYF